MNDDANESLFCPFDIDRFCIKHLFSKRHRLSSPYPVNLVVFLLHSPRSDVVNIKYFYSMLTIPKGFMVRALR